MESMLRWVSNDKLDQMTLWMLRRLLKFCLKKYIGPYIRGELDLEQLDFQLCSAAGLNDVALNVDAINAKLDDYPIALKEGSVGRVTVTLLPKLNIELDGVELRFVPKTATDGGQSKAASSESTFEAQQLESETENVGVNGVGGYSYLPVQEGVRVVANLFERLLFGVRVTVSQIFIAIEEMPNMRHSENSSFTSHCMLLFRIGHAEYRASRSTGIEGGRQGEESSSFTSDISFQQMCVELVEIQSEGCECPLSVAGDTKVYGQPISLMQDDAGLSGHVKLGIRTKDGSLDVPKLDADIDLEHIRLHFTAHQIQQLLRVICSYSDSNGNVGTAQGVDQNDHTGLSSNELIFSKKAADMIDSREATSSKLVMLSSQSRSSKPSLLPGAKFISDWVHWNGGEKNTEEAVMSEEEFAASTEEFFDCLSGSGLWMWTCSALSAISAASNLASGSVLHSQEFARQVAYVIKVKIAGVSAILKEGHWRNYHMEAIIRDIDLSLQVCQRRLKWQLRLKCVEGFQVQNQEKKDVNLLHEQNEDILLEVVSASAQPLQALVEQSVPKFPVSLCEGSQTGRACAVQKKCFLRLSEQGYLAGVQVDVKHNFTQNPGGEAGRKTEDVTEVSFHFQPLVLWIDASIICMLHEWIESFQYPAINSKKACLPSDTGLSLPSKRRIHINLYFSSIRLWLCSPCSLGSRFSKDHLLCIDLSCPAEKVRRPMVKLRFFDSAISQLCLRSATISLKESYIYLISPSKVFEKGAALSFNAHKILSMSLCSPELASVDILLRNNPSGGISLAERAWTGVTEQQKGGTGGRKTSSEFAAATVTEAMDENNQKMREDIVLFSSTCVLVVIPRVKVDLLASQHSVVIEILQALVEVSNSIRTSNSGRLVDEKDNQVSVSLDVGEAEITLHSSPEMISSTFLEKKTSGLWEKYIVYLGKLQVLHVVKLGMVKDASYFWLRHGNGYVKGLLSDIGSGDILQLLTCQDNTLGRGDGGGGNALATKSAGIEVSVISWPGGSHAEDMLITIGLGGCTFMAHGGRLDWLPRLITFFSHRADKSTVNHAILEKSCLSAIETSAVRLDASATRTGGEASSTNNYVLFSLDLHDAALCYEPGKEAASAANLRAKNSTEQFSPVACLIAAAAVRVSSNAISDTASKDYEIWLRDVALLLSDTTLRKNSAIDYTPESLHQAGYVKVAGEAVMEAVVHINGEDGLGWGVECANNQLRVDTCHDTTAALGRLIAQVQQLFVPEVEHPVAVKSTKHNVSTSCVEESSEEQSCNGGTEKCSSAFDVINSKNAALFEEFLEDAFMFVRGCPAHSCCNCLDLNPKLAEKFEVPFNGVAQESQWCQDGEEGEDLRTPVSQSEDAPSFIEDYYVSKKSSLQSSSQSSSCRGSGVSLQNSGAPSDDFDMLDTADGSGGWYDGHSFKFVEDHVPMLDNKPGFNKHRGDLLQSSRRRLGLSLKYPQTSGRVVFQDLNLRWRLYGGSDWPKNKRKDPVSVSFTSPCTSGRQTGLCLEVIFHGVDLQHDTFPEIGVYASRLALSIRDVRIYDCSKDAPWKKILGYHHSKSRPRESSAKALNLELESVRPDPVVPLEEYRLSVQLLPILLHLDQRHIDFLTNFFTAPPASSQKLHLGYEEISLSYSSFETRVPEGLEEVLLPVFQVCELQPFSIRVDYIPRRVDINALRSGNYAELANLVSWKGIELELKHVKATGVHGWGTLSGIVVGEWLEDISRNQIHKLLKGLGPIRPLFAVGSGAAKLVVLPAEQYKRDRRCLLRGMRKGAIAFLRSISLEAVGLGVQLAAGAHEILIQTESALGSVALSNSLEKVEVRTKVDQPGDMREGLQQACERLSQGLERTASSLIGNPLKAYHRAGTSTAVASALRAAPAAAVAPAAAAAGALHRALLGVRNSLDPEHHRESEEKHSGPPPE